LALSPKFRTKNAGVNVDEIVNWCQFHQHFIRAFCANIFVPKKLQRQNITREKLHKALLYE